METSIDLYAEENADDYDVAEVVELEDENEEQHLENEDNQETETTENDEDKKKVKPKRVIKNPRPKLNAEALRGHKGLTCLEGYFKNKKYKGRGHEEEDLRTIMKTYEYWCHRLFPKFPFDDCIAKIEKLGTKKNVQTYINRIRMDLIFDEEQPVRSDNEGEHLNDAISDQFDNLLSQEDDSHDTSDLTEEQLERIQINKEKANRLRQEKLERAKEKAQVCIFPDNSSALVGTENIGNSSQNDLITENEVRDNVTENEKNSFQNEDYTEIVESELQEDNIENSIISKVTCDEPREEILPPKSHHDEKAGTSMLGEQMDGIEMNDSDSTNECTSNINISN